MKFAQFHVGQLIEAGPYRVDERELIDFAKQWDPQWFHTNPNAAARSRFGGLIASGWHTCGIAMRLAVQVALDGSEVFASPGLNYLKWPNPVRPGDSLTLRINVLEKRRSNSQPNLGIVRWRWRVLNADGLEVLDLEATNLFELVE
jgi:acyl dehydratase